ncbi:MAG: DUF433 domain-containing protein [Nanoarchaeota archaeon]
MRIEINQYIVTDSEICGGTPTFKGTRVMVWQVMELLGAGVSIEEILQNYFPHITRPAILSVLTYASKLIGEEKNVLFQ